MAERVLKPGPIALFGSGETAPTGGVVYDEAARNLPRPLRIAVLETPAGFQPNSERVAERVAEFMEVRLQNEKPEIQIVPARKRGTPNSPDSPDVAAMLRPANMLFLGPGSPTYAAAQLRDSLTWATLEARHRHGAAVVTASAATIALGALTLPVYEIYKAGSDLHWQPGLDFFGPYGLSLVFMPHWNNTDGGEDLDTTHCYMGLDRYHALLDLLPEGMTVVGIDEHSALVIDLEAERCKVLGKGGVSVIRDRREQRFQRGDAFPLAVLGTLRWPAPAEGIPDEVWEQAGQAAEPEDEPGVPEDVLALVEQRQSARAARNWAAADDLRDRIAGLGWQVRDTPEGPVVEPVA